MSKQLITPELANEWVTSYFYEKPLMHSVMRNIRESHVNYLVSEMRRGMFGSATISFADCKENGRRFIINGNHTLRAIIRSGVNLYLTVEQNECDTMDQVRHLYATYDKNLLRQRADSLRAYNAHEQLNIRLDDVNRLSSAVMMILGGYEYERARGRISDAEVLEAMRPWAEPYGRLLAAVGTSTWYKKIIGRRPVLAVALPTMRYQKDLAFPFWESVATGETKKNSPQLRLRDYLMEVNVQGGGGTKGEQVKPVDMAKVIAYCWNKYFNGEQIIQMRVSYDKPIVILGTPFDGKEPQSKTVKGYTKPIAVPA